MAWNTKSCLNRWCLRTLLEKCDALLHDTSEHVSAELLAHARHLGPPPLEHSCIAPHCEQWESIDEEHGVCRYRQQLMGVLRDSG